MSGEQCDFDVEMDESASVEDPENDEDDDGGDDEGDQDEWGGAGHSSGKVFFT